VIRLIDGDDVDALATSDAGLAAARETARLVADGGFSTGRVQIGDPQAWMRVLAGSLPALDLMGYKEFHRVGKHVLYHVSLFRHSTGEPIGIVDGRRITSLRTASTAAIAFRHGFADEEIAIGVIGSGEEALEGLRAIAGALSIRRAAVFSPTAANRHAYAATMSAELGVEVVAARSVEDALAGADAAYVATAATSPVVCHEHVRHLRFVGAVGATRPDHHELSGDVVANAAGVVVDCHDALEEPGDMRDALRFGWDPSTATLLGDWLGHSPRPAGDGALLFKSIGSVEQDLVLAHHLLMAAQERGLGRMVDPIGSLRVMR
jgi:ornithine cyclodeaminase/alanine dehydrogenase-like protein (mu-crystallin family)